jgi:N4-gp56 family major capsid protein
MTNYVLLNLQLFAEIGPLTKTHLSNGDPSVSWKTFYDTTLLENSKENNVFDQFGMQQPIKGGKCEWRKFNTFDKAMNPLTEGVIPTGQLFGTTAIEAEVNQYGDYTTLTDRVQAEMYDDFIFGASEEMGVAMGATKDTLTRNILVAGNSVQYCPRSDDTEVTTRHLIDNTCILTPAMVHKAATWLQKNKAPKIDGYYVAVIHPSVAFDLRQSEEWKQFHQYNDVAPIFKGEIGTLHGVRFVESTSAKIYKGDNTVYCTFFFGKDAFGVLDIDGEGQEMIVKTKAQVGGPLEQFGTVGYKFNHGAKILYPERMLRVESGSSMGDEDEEN